MACITTAWSSGGHALNAIKMPKLILKKLCNKNYPSILVTFWGETAHFSGKIEALRWGILVGKQKHNVQNPTNGQVTVNRHSRDHVHVGMYFGKPASVMQTLRPLSTPCRGRIVAFFRVPQLKRIFSADTCFVWIHGRQLGISKFYVSKFACCYGFRVPQLKRISLRTHVSSESTGDNWAFQSFTYQTLSVVMVRIFQDNEACVDARWLIHTTRFELYSWRELVACDRVLSCKSSTSVSRRTPGKQTKQGEHRGSFVSVTGKKVVSPPQVGSPQLSRYTPTLSHFAPNFFIRFRKQ